jgi:3-dehydroquinate synthase
MVGIYPNSEKKMKQIRIRSNLYNYSVEFIDDFSHQLVQLSDDNTCTYVVDKNIFHLYNDKFINIEKSNIFLLDAVEQKKNIHTVLELIKFWRPIKKNYKAICIGGGITQDIVSFTSNIYLRNIDWYFFPTTLLSMCDSCIGGKCGINFNEYKNQLGVFYPPRKIFIDTKFLDSLSSVDYINGWGELLKFSLTRKKSFFNNIQKLDQYIPCKTIDSFIFEGLCIKKEIIEKDEFEGDLRRVLNYGHTFGHALESHTHNRVAHGTAVIWGIDVVNYIAYRCGILSENDYMKIKSLIKTAFIKNEIIITDAEMLFNIIKTDKKVKSNTIHLALLNRISHLIIHPMEIDSTLLSFFIDYLKETHEYYSN